MSGPAKAPRGFANMDRQRVRELASRGGIKAAELSRAGLGGGHKFNSDTARAAALKRYAAK